MFVILNSLMIWSSSCSWLLELDPNKSVRFSSRSANGVTGMVDDTVLLLLSNSASAPETVAAFTRFPTADGSSTKVTDNNLLSPEARFPIRQVTSRPDTEQSDGSAPEGSRWRPSASTSITVTLVASEGPSFLMVYSKVIRSPAVAEAKTSLSEIIRSGMSRTVVLSSAVAAESPGSAPSPS